MFDNKEKIIEDISRISKIHKSRIHNIYLFGSRVYKTHTDKSDYDIILVANNSVECVEIKHPIYNIHIYTPDKFKSDLLWYRPQNMECIFAPDFAKIQENIKYNLDIDIKKIRHSISHVSSNSWVKAKKKMTLSNEDKNIGLKSLFHSLRIPMFAIQILKDGKITNFSEANDIWFHIRNNSYQDWDYFNKYYKKLHNKILSDFRLLTKK